MRIKDLFALIILTIFLGCSQEVRYVDSNTDKEVAASVKKKEFKTIHPEVVCDERGYAYYEFMTSAVGPGPTYSYIPILDNSNVHHYTVQTLCKDLE